MRTVLGLLLTLLVVVAVALLALPAVVPQAWLQATLAERLEAATGRPVDIGGPVALRVIPTPAAELNDVTVANVPDGEAAHLLEADRIRAELAPLALFQGRAEVQSFVIDGFALNLEIDAAGEANWRLQAPAQTDATPPSVERGADETAPAPTRDMAVTLADVRLVDGMVRFSDVRTGVARTLAAIDGEVAMAAIDAPLTVDLQARLDDRPVAVEARIATLEQVFAGAPFDAEVTVASEGSEAGFTGTVHRGPLPGLDGALRADIRHASRTLSWLAGRPVDVPAQDVQLTTALAGNTDGLVLEDLRIDTGAGAATGRLDLDLEGRRPRLVGRLAFGTIDLGALARDGAPAEGTGDATASAGGGAEAAEPTLNMPPLPVDLDLAFTFDRLTGPPLTLGAGDLALRGEGGDLRVEVARLALYGGSATGEIHLAPASPGVRIAPHLALRGVRTAPLLEALTGRGFLDGTGDLDIDLRAAGTDQTTLVASLAGTGSLALERAVLRGLAGEPGLEALRGLLALGGEPGAPIGLADIAASFRIDRGVLRNEDLRARAPALTIAGAGSVDLAGRRVPGYTLRPSATGPLAGVEDIARLMIPVVVSGPFADLRVRPAPEAAGGQALDAVTDALEQAREKAEQGDLEGAAETIIEEGLGGVLRGFGIRP